MIAAIGARTRCQGLKSWRRRPGAGRSGSGGKRSGPTIRVAAITASSSRAVVDTPAADPQLRERDEEDRDEQHVGDRGAITAVEELERLLVEVVDDDRCRAQRAAAR